MIVLSTLSEESSCAFDQTPPTPLTVGDLEHILREEHTRERAHQALLLASSAPPRIAALLKRGIVKRMGLCPCDWCLTTGSLEVDADTYTTTPCPACEGWGYDT